MPKKYNDFQKEVKKSPKPKKKEVWKRVKPKVIKIASGYLAHKLFRGQDLK